MIPRWRRVLVGVLVVIVCILVPVSVMGVWLRNTLLHTGQWVETLAPLADDPAVQEAVAARVTNAVVQGTDLEDRIADVLPGRAKPAAPFIAGGAAEVVDRVTLRIVESDQFRDLWEVMLRRSHQSVLAVLQGKGTDTIQTRNGRIVVSTGPVAEKVVEALQATGIGFFDDVDLDRVDREIVLVESEELRRAQDAVDIFDSLANILPLVTLGVFAIAVALSRTRRRTVLWTALGVALAVGIVLTLLNLGRSAYLGALPPSVNEDAARAVYDQVLVFLRTALRTAFAVALVVAIGAWLSGPGSLAVRLRGLVRREPIPGEAPTAVAAFVVRYRAALQVVVVALGLVILVALEHPRPLALLVVALIVLAALVVIEFLARRHRQATAA